MKPIDSFPVKGHNLKLALNNLDQVLTHIISEIRNQRFINDDSGGPDLEDVLFDAIMLQDEFVKIKRALL